MLVKAEQRYVRTSPRKLRFVADSVRGVNSPDKALSLLEALDKRAALPILKTIKQAVANATNNMGLPRDSLKIKELQITEGPIYKRGRPVARGRFHKIQKKTSHIRVVLEAEPPKTTKSALEESRSARSTKSETKENSKNAKK